MIVRFYILVIHLIPTKVLPAPQGKTIIPDLARWDANIVPIAFS